MKATIATHHRSRLGLVAKRLPSLLHRGAHSSVLAALVLIATGCGGGSSGTGEGIRSEGQVLDKQCQPVVGLDLSTLGLLTTEPQSREDGAFELDPTVSGPVRVPAGSGTPEIDVSEPACILIVYQEGGVVSVNSYSLGDIPECSLEGVTGIVPPEELPSCQEQAPAER